MNSSPKPETLKDNSGWGNSEHVSTHLPTASKPPGGKILSKLTVSVRMLSLHSKHLNATYHCESEENVPAKLQAKFEKLHGMNWDGPSCLATVK